MTFPTAMLHNTETDRFHPIVFRYAPPPSGDLGDTGRYKSIGHHTEGFSSLEAAISFASGADRQPAERYQSLCWTGEMWEWDGQEMPAMVIWRPKTWADGKKESTDVSNQAAGIECN